jgi:hypothetical protein
VKCDCGTTQSCYIPSHWVTESLFFVFKFPSGRLQCHPLLFFLVRLRLFVFTIFLPLQGCCEVVDTGCPDTPWKSLTDNAKKTLTSTPRCSTWFISLFLFPLSVFSFFLYLECVFFSFKQSYEYEYLILFWILQKYGRVVYRGISNIIILQIWAQYILSRVSYITRRSTLHFDYTNPSQCVKQHSFGHVPLLSSN